MPTSFKYSNNFKIIMTFEAKWVHNLVVGLQSIIGCKATWKSIFIVIIKKYFCSSSKNGIIEGTTRTPFINFALGWENLTFKLPSDQESDLCIKCHPIIKINNPICIHQLLGEEVSIKLYNQPLDCTCALSFYKCNCKCLDLPIHH